MVAIVDRMAIKRRMKALQIPSQRVLAKQMGMDYIHLNRIINGRAFTSTTLGRLAKALDCSPKSLVKA